MKTPEKGSRKVHVTQTTANHLTLGFIVMLISAGFFKFEVSLCAPLFVTFAAGLVGKDTAFIWGNRTEHKKEEPRQ